MQALLLTLALIAPPQTAADPAEPAIRIDVTRAATAPEWTATYTLDAPVTRLVFSNNTTLFRSDTWEVVTEGLELVVEGEHEVLRAEDYAHFTTATVRFATNNAHFVKDYTFHVPFTDGGVLLYTGHLAVRSQDGPLRTEFALSGLAGERVLHGGVSAQACTIEDAGRTGGTFVYFGTAPVVETEHVVGIVDPGLPAWVRADTERYLPALFELYAERLGRRFERKPMVYFSYSSGRLGVSDFSGGALPGLIQLTLTGQAWAQRDESAGGALVRLVEFLAHESVHLWNMPGGEGPPRRGAAWMHEGGADALAFRALHELGLVDRAGLFGFYTRSVNEAARGLDGCALRESAEQGRFRNFYTSGSTLGLATELALQAVDPDLDLFDFWRELLSEAHARGGAYSEQDYFALCDRRAPESGLGSALGEFIDRQHEDPAAAFMDLLAPYAGVRASMDFDTGEITLEPGDG